MSKLRNLTNRPASDSLVEHLAETVQQRLAHTHPQPGGGEDLYCLNLTSYMGERMGAVLVRLRETTALSRAMEERILRALALLDEWELGDAIHPGAADELRRLFAPEGGA